jgi:hypothetical protein
VAHDLSDGRVGCAKYLHLMDRGNGDMEKAIGLAEKSRGDGERIIFRK